MPTIAILGASSDRRKYGNKAVRAYREQGYDVYPVNPRATEVEGLPAYPSLDAVPVPRLDRISVYLPPAVGLAMLEEIARKPAAEVWFNPGSESPELLERAHALGLEPILACSLIAANASPTAWSDE